MAMTKLNRQFSRNLCKDVFFLEQNIQWRFKALYLSYYNKIVLFIIYYYILLFESRYKNEPRFKILIL